MSAGASPHTPAAVRTSQEGSSNDATALLALLMSGTASAHLGHPVSRGDELGSKELSCAHSRAPGSGPPGSTLQGATHNLPVKQCDAVALPT